MAQKVTIDYAHDYDFTKIKTFQYVATDDSDVKGNDLMDQRVEDMIKKELREGGGTEVQSNPDIYVTYHFTSMGYGGYGGYYGGWGGWGGGGMGSSTTYATTYTEGTLIIDFYDPDSKKLIWRGTGTVTVKAKPEKQIKQVDNILTKIGNKWEKIVAGQGK